MYNLWHHKGIAIVLPVAGFYLNDLYLQVAGIIMFSQSSLDRLLGYGLKYNTDLNSPIWERLERRRQFPEIRVLMLRLMSRRRRC